MPKLSWWNRNSPRLCLLHFTPQPQSITTLLPWCKCGILQLCCKKITIQANTSISRFVRNSIDNFCYSSPFLLSLIADTHFAVPCRVDRCFVTFRDQHQHRPVSCCNSRRLPCLCNLTLSLESTPSVSLSTSFWYQFLRFRLTCSFTHHFFLVWFTTLLVHNSLSLSLPA